MKTIALLILTFVSTVSRAQIMPESAATDMAVDEAVVSCLFENQDLDFTGLKINSAGDMVVTVNPKYVAQEFAPFLIYKGMEVTMTSMDSKVSVRGTLLTLTGEVVIDLNLVRGEVNQVVMLNENLICEVH